MESTQDYLGLINEPKIVQIFDPGETIIFSNIIYKFNPLNWKQKRNLLITDKYLYNFKGTNLKRRIKLLNVAATTVSEDPESKEFVIHVPVEYDYRYTSDM